ncbi:carboxy terminal-processing peptidase [Flavisolibacter tropicus]|uniref:Carboxyl-terminal protease n=1 Tax=Flavisolibacter tropicus TaxID=1492898 RepID=A0A172U270_9BACT|nr:carboxy terminal-processing peptidase [Flavisolibacter tropicus]ANE53258.1 carboxyl-terminal protease [Flavisolibacter tropicus]
MKRLPLLLLMLAGGIFLAFQTLGIGKAAPPSKYERILQNVGVLLTQGHFSPKDINDDFSKKIFNKYFEELDGDKNIFMQEDIDALKKYETRLDDEMKGAPVEFFLEVSKRFNARVEEASKIYKDILAQPFDFTVDESIITDNKKIKFPTTQAERKEMWRKKLKYLTLDRYAELLDIREKNKGKDSFVVKTDAQLEKEARDKVSKIMERTFERYKFKFNDDDKFSIYVNTITQTMDPHTEFFAPVEKRYFDEQLSGSFSGIGASLQYDEGNIKIASLLTGSPAWKSQQIEVGDVVMKVAQANDTAVELTGYVVEDAVKLIRGKKGTPVTLTLKKKDGSLKNVTLIRDEIKQDETFARSAVIENGASKVGYIYLPEFYADFENPNGARSADDVGKEILKLKAANVDGLVIDLRNNGGGSLFDVVKMVGFFIEDGPIVQVKDREGKPMVMRDKDNGILYDGPLTVLVNEFSASASEIFAAAIQDYGRGVVIGSSSTYGKGTVQRNFSLDPDANILSSNSELGSVKLTLQKFYRVNGGSTQLKGVVPDLVIPDQYEYLKFRERDNENALPWDEVNKATYKAWNGGYDLNTIKNLSNSRIVKTPAFQKIKQKTEWLSSQSDKEYPLQLAKFQKEQVEIKAAVKEIDSLLKLNTDLNIAFLKQDADRYALDKAKEDRYNQWLKQLKKDIYLDQAVKVIGDINSQRNLVKGQATKPEKPVKSF